MTKRKIGVAHGIELFTVADMVHLFALAMDYAPKVAFALGEISRSMPSVQSGECDVDAETAKKAVIIAMLLAKCRKNGSLPEDAAQRETVQTVVEQVHSIEQAYVELCNAVPEVREIFSRQYEESLKLQKPPSVMRRFFNYFQSRELGQKA
jgi:hypothetical protein